ncbi:uncharacterized protein MELLADRAFT_93241 [Melampsora larici-populina 98AG31]|uniref:Uncharacterized protein n=1 Tax=Melampsora larici-populina (strain 98AG31 / pathotype 3-4-7) TaxID=747676 RepID=F4S4G2_MELLP|nr:uncharacterized protein MELLADRAFT_93241 [Melampsora larici-populina 98AG31]EGG00407.1 hypothetical protein MELLADRAFT_93241 [Melampsora larici-populina 98AG31]
MDHHPAYYVYLPNYMLEYVVGETNPRIDVDLFLSKATPNQIVEVISAFHPRLRLTRNAEEDHELLLKLFIEKVAPRLSRLISSLNGNKNYIQGLFACPVYKPDQLTSRWINSSADYDPKRIDMFDTGTLMHLRSGKYRLAAESLQHFIESYTFLNQAEIDEIIGAQTDAEDTLHDTSIFLERSVESIKSIHLQLRLPTLSRTERGDLEEELKCAKASLRSRQGMFNAAIEDVGFLRALAKHHDPPKTSTRSKLADREIIGALAEQHEFIKEHRPVKTLNH